MNIFGISEQNRQPEPPARKPNEDHFGYACKGQTLVAAVMDGIPVLRDENGVYPEENGSIASRIAVETICGSVLKSGESLVTADLLTKAFCAANGAVKTENERLSMYEKKAPYWLATVGCAFLVDMATRRSYFGYIGDPLAFLVSPDHGVELLTEDQLKPFEMHLYECHKSEIEGRDPGAMKFIREYQDSRIRNHLDSRCYCGAPLRGWGALTGENCARLFVETKTISTPPGARVILASDAIEAVGAGNAKERKAEDYKDMLLSISKLTAQDAARELLRLTRAGEIEKKCKSDDATFVVIDF